MSMRLRDQEEKNLWKSVYIAVINSYSNDVAKSAASEAVNNFRELTEIK